ncbi:K+-transporting ATPase KdpF subunit [Rudaeicoccus suwonensis]|uniref:K+-transporting ATPase KdpF subunit n=1 Tax=Rudaeicoccus suwonensis TaxID=657409 RepID=A0A561ECL4_9MICO|nr:K+-transporting ATPase KdpF subunit [Rudaeicoccus suwonensis]
MSEGGTPHRRIFNGNNRFRLLPVTTCVSAHRIAGRKNHVNAPQGRVNSRGAAPYRSEAGRMAEYIVAGVIAFALLVYLVYALIYPDKF